MDFILYFLTNYLLLNLDEVYTKHLHMTCIIMQQVTIYIGFQFIVSLLHTTVVFMTIFSETGIITFTFLYSRGSSVSTVYNFLSQFQIEMRNFGAMLGLGSKKV